MNKQLNRRGATKALAEAIVGLQNPPPFDDLQSTLSAMQSALYYLGLDGLSVNENTAALARELEEVHGGGSPQFGRR
jgi:hypothetical protein